MRDCAIADWDLWDWADGGRLAEPTLLEYELLETFRSEVLDDGRDEETEDEKEFSRGTPAMEVALT